MLIIPLTDDDVLDHTAHQAWLNRDTVFADQRAATPDDQMPRSTPWAFDNNGTGQLDRFDTDSLE